MAIPLGQQLLIAADGYCEATGYARATLSTMLFSDNKTLDRVANGGSLTVRNFEHAMRWLVTHWPAGRKWPQGVMRFEPLSEPVDKSGGAAISVAAA